MLIEEIKDTIRQVPDFPKKGIQFLDITTGVKNPKAFKAMIDFLYGEFKDKKVDYVAGIESPGLSAAPAIAEYVGQTVAKAIGAEEKNSFIPERKAPVRFRNMSNEERKELVKKNPAYGRIICRCETVTEGEILDAIHAPAGARDVDGVKRRTRAGMGRCQGGFCGSKVVELLARELGVEINEITKFGGESKILYDRTK